MATPNTSPASSTFDLTPPYRPGLTDFMGCALEDDPDNPPDPATFITAALINLFGFLCIAYGKVVPAAILSVTAGIPPTITLLSAPGSNVAAGDFVVTRNSAGNVTISWPANELPPPVAWPHATIAGALGNHNYSVSCTAGTPLTTTVYTNVDSTPTDLSFVLTIY